MLFQDLQYTYLAFQNLPLNNIYFITREEIYIMYFHLSLLFFVLLLLYILLHVLNSENIVIFYLNTYVLKRLKWELVTKPPPPKWESDQIRSVAQSCLTLCNPMNRSTPGLPVHHQLLEFTETHVHRVSDAIQPSHPLSSPSPPALNPSQHQSLFQWVNSSHEVAKVLEFQL